MRVLIGCEESGIVRDSFIKRGHDAWSCDLLHRDHERHITGDIMSVLNDGWDLMILHPPCTALAVSGNAHYGIGKPKNGERIRSIEWTLKLWREARRACDMVALENPVGVLPIKPAQYIQPWEYGHGETKKTGLWLHGLPRLIPTDVVEGRDQRIWLMPPSTDRQRLRSQTYQGIADAMADQWGAL